MWTVNKQNEYCSLIVFLFCFSRKPCWQTARFLCLVLGRCIACVPLLLLWLASPTSRGRLVATYSSSGTTHTYIQTPLLLYLFWERSREVVCVARFCSQRGTRPAAQSPSEAAAGFSELSKLDLPSSFQSFVFLCFHVKWTDEILSLLISGTQNHRFKPKAKTPQAQFHLKGDTAILVHHVTNFHYTKTCHRHYNIKDKGRKR